MNGTSLAWAQIISAVVVALGGGGALVALYRVRAERERIYTDATKQVVATSLTLLHPLEERSDRLQKQVRKLELMVAALRTQLEEERIASRREIARLTDERDAARAALGRGKNDHVPE